jgi:hypothetical protein
LFAQFGLCFCLEVCTVTVYGAKYFESDLNNYSNFSFPDSYFDYEQIQIVFVHVVYSGLSLISAIATAKESSTMSTSTLSNISQLDKRKAEPQFPNQVHTAV